MPTLELNSVPRQPDGLYQLRMPDHSNMVMPGLSDTIFGEAPTDDPGRTWNYSFNAANIPSLMQSCIDVPQSDRSDPATFSDTQTAFRAAIYHLAQKPDNSGNLPNLKLVGARLNYINDFFSNYGRSLPDISFRWLRETNGRELITQRLEQVLTVSGISRFVEVVRNPSVLSIGCGLAEELPILTRLWNRDVDYTGVDSNQNLAKMFDSLTAYYPDAKFVIQDASQVTNMTPDLVVIRNPNISAAKETGLNQENIKKWAEIIKNVANRYPKSAVLITTCFSAEHYHAFQAVQDAWPNDEESHFKSGAMGFRTSHDYKGTKYSRKAAPDRTYIRVIPKASPFYATLVNQDNDNVR